MHRRNETIECFIRKEKATFYRFLMVAIMELDLVDPFPYDTKSAFFYFFVFSFVL